jgi:hypothetical protein
MKGVGESVRKANEYMKLGVKYIGRERKEQGENGR